MSKLKQAKLQNEPLFHKDGRPVLRGWWKDEKQSGLITEPCPYCGIRHHHAYPGMRPGEVAHWASPCAPGHDEQGKGYWVILVDSVPTTAKK